MGKNREFSEFWRFENPVEIDRCKVYLLVVQKQPKYKDLAEVLREKISRLPKSSKLPSLRSMMSRYNVSLQTVNSAISELMKEGLIISKRRSGLYVSQNRPTKHIAFCRTNFPALIPDYYEASALSAAKARGWTLLSHRISPHQKDIEIDADAAIFTSDIFGRDDASRRLFEELPMPKVVLNNQHHAFNVDSVSATESEMFHLVLKELQNLGHERIAYLVSEPLVEEIEARIKIFKTTSTQLNFKEALVIDSQVQFGEHSAYPTARALHKFIQKQPSQKLPFTALICCSVPGSFVALRVLQDSNIRVPQDCSVFCMGEDIYAAATKPAITNLNLSLHLWGVKCIEVLDRRFSGDESLCINVKINPKINWRETVAAPGSKSPITSAEAMYFSAESAPLPIIGSSTTLTPAPSEEGDDGDGCHWSFVKK